MKELSRKLSAEEIVCFNGSLMPLSQVRISPFDYGFLYGYGLFETMRAYSGHIFCLDRHLTRLSDSARYLGIDLKPVINIEKFIYDTLQANNLSDGRIRVTISGGEGEPTPGLTAHQNPTLLIIARNYIPYTVQIYEQGYKAMISSIRRNTHSPVTSMKSLNYMESILVNKEAKLSGFDEGIFLNDKGLLAETSTGNIFLISGNTLLTPDRDSGILPGVTREIVLELANLLNMDVIEREITAEELFQADEAFFTNSIIEIMPLTQVNSQPIGSSKMGRKTQRILADYKKLTGLQTNAF